MTNSVDSVDAVLVGGGIMSATLGVLLKQVEPEWDIVAFERLDAVGEESSFGWHNAGTGHAGLCELNYTPQNPDGGIDIGKAVVTNEQFRETLQFWASLVDRGALSDPRDFVNTIPHMSYVRGSDDVAFLRQRYELLKRHPLFETMAFTDDPSDITDWVPLMMRGRTGNAPVAMTRVDEGTDVNFGAVTKRLFDIQQANGTQLHLGTEVTDLDLQPDGSWLVTSRVRATGEERQHRTRFVFVGAGGKAIHLLQKSHIPEARGYGGFPVSGQFLRCTNPDLIEEHDAKVYGKPQVKAPPMSMPHLDRRYSDRKPGLLFGPYAGFTPKFLKQGSFADLPTSIQIDNIPTMLTVAKDEFELTKYLVGQVLQKHESRIDVLQDFVPTADAADWELITAGQRVQTMKRTGDKRGKIVFGTEVVVSRDGTVAGLMGASPGASTAVSIMIDVLRRSFPEAYPAWQSRLLELVPSVGMSLTEDPILRSDVERFVNDKLELATSNVPEVVG